MDHAEPIEPRVVTFIEAVFLRPRMYTLGGSFAEVVSFCEGYASGPVPHMIGYAEKADSWYPFCRWLIEQFLEGRGDGLRAYFRSIRDDCVDDRAAIDRLLMLYRRFLVEAV